MAELTKRAALADNTTTPTTALVGSCGLMYDGATWDLVRGDSTNGLLVNLGTNNDVTVTGSVTADTELPAAAALADNAATPTAPAVGAFGMFYDGATWDMMRGDATNGLLVNLGTNNDVTVTGTVTTVPSATATGCSVLNDSSVDNSAQALKASSGRLYGLTIYNPNVTAAYLQLFDVAAAGVTPGVTANKFWIPIPAQGALFVAPTSVPMGEFATAMTYCATTTASGGVALGSALEACFFYM